MNLHDLDVRSLLFLSINYSMKTSMLTDCPATDKYVQHIHLKYTRNVKWLCVKLSISIKYDIEHILK